MSEEHFFVLFETTEQYMIPWGPSMMSHMLWSCFTFCYQWYIDWNQVLWSRLLWSILGTQIWCHDPHGSQLLGHHWRSIRYYVFEQFKFVQWRQSPYEFASWFFTKCFVRCFSDIFLFSKIRNMEKIFVMKSIKYFIPIAFCIGILLT